MGKNILIITGSFRANGNSDTLADAFAKGAQASGNTVHTLRACELNMDGCHGDASCHQRGYCGLKDDGVKVHEELCWADTLVFATPVYWKSFTAHLKKVIDRLYPYAAPKGRDLINVKDTYLIATANSPDPAVFGPMKEEFELINTLLKFNCAGMLLCNGLGGPEAIKDHPEYIEEAIKMGASIGGACGCDDRYVIGLLYFYLPGCKYCKAADEILKELQAGNPEFAKVEVIKIDEKERPEIAAKFTHSRVPSIFLGDNKLYEAFPGEDTDKMRASLEQVLKATVEVNKSVADMLK